MASASSIKALFADHARRSIQERLIRWVWWLVNLGLGVVAALPLLRRAVGPVGSLITALSAAEVAALLAPSFTFAIIQTSHYIDRMSGGGLSSLARLEARDEKNDSSSATPDDGFNRTSRIVPPVLTKLAILMAVAILGLTEVAERASELSRGFEASDFFIEGFAVAEAIGPYPWWSLTIAGLTLITSVILMAGGVLCYDFAIRFRNKTVARNLTWRGWHLEAYGFYFLAWGMVALVGFFSPYVCLIANFAFGSCLLYYFYPDRRLRDDLSQAESEVAPPQTSPPAASPPPPAPPPPGSAP